MLIAPVLRIPTKARALARLRQQMVDYVGGTMGLLMQRQAIYLSTAILAVAYFDMWLALGCYSLVQATELFDIWLARRILRFDEDTPVREVVQSYAALMVNTVASALAISFFILTIAQMQGPGSHFTPLFFLFAAALFAAMNNHQLLQILIVRLVIYTVAFIAIPVIDLIAVRPPLTDPLWLQFFTVLFVLFFIFDSSMVYIKLYRKTLDQLENLRAEKEKATEAFVAKSRFLSTISHELRTPLTSIDGALSLIRSSMGGNLAAAQDRMLTVAEANTKKLSGLVGDVLDVQSLEAGELVINQRPMELVHVIDAAVERNRAAATQKNISFDWQVVDPVMVFSDRKRVDRVLDCVISNAIKFSDGGSEVALDVTIDDKLATVSVTNTGVGIPEGKEETVFSNFSQVDGSDIRRAGGLGIGLFLAKAIVEKMGGTIGYHSVEGEQTTFHISFALSDTEPKKVSDTLEAA